MASQNTYDGLERKEIYYPRFFFRKQDFYCVRCTACAQVQVTSKTGFPQVKYSFGAFIKPLSQLLSEISGYSKYCSNHSINNTRTKELSKFIKFK